MNKLDKKVIAYLGRKPDFQEEVNLQNDGSGDYISFWSDSLEKSKPTDEQLNALESEATTIENNDEVRFTRKKAYGNIGEQLDEIYKDIDAWKTRIKAIKDANPKS